MFLLYTDESGEPRNQDEEYFVLGAVAVFERTAYFLSKTLDDVEKKWFPGAPDRIEFHASHMRNGHGEPWHSLGRTKSKEVLLDVCNAITSDTHERGMYFFGIAVHKKSFPHDDPVEKAFHELCGHFDAFLTMNNLVTSGKNRGLMILDSSRYRGHLDKLLIDYRTKGAKFGKVKNFADAPAFADSKTTRLLQVADIVSNGIYRRYEHSDATIFDKILPRFHRENTKLHGLMHLVANWKSCLCPSCLSRL